MTQPPDTQTPFFEFLLRHADDLLILGQRLSEWCGHAPILEEDIALSNIALDFVGQAESLLTLAGEIENAGRSEDDLAYFRDEVEFRNLELVEQPNGDFATTMVRQFFFDAYAYPFYKLMAQSQHVTLSGIAAKALKEATYHLRHSRNWVLRMGDGTAESKHRAQTAVDQLWTFTGELFFQNHVDQALVVANLIPDWSSVREEWTEIVTSTLEEATLRTPENAFMAQGARLGRHSEHLGHLLAEMQILARSHPGAAW